MNLESKTADRWSVIYYIILGYRNLMSSYFYSCNHREYVYNYEIYSIWKRTVIEKMIGSKVDDECCRIVGAYFQKGLPRLASISCWNADHHGDNLPISNQRIREWILKARQLTVDPRECRREPSMKRKIAADHAPPWSFTRIIQHLIEEWRYEDPRFEKWKIIHQLVINLWSQRVSVNSRIFLIHSSS